FYYSSLPPPHKPTLFPYTTLFRSLNGIAFSSAPPKFWEQVKDVDVKEPTPSRPINRAGIIIQEPDGRIWIVQPTNQFGNRKHTLDRKSTRLNSSHVSISYAVFCLK